MTTLPALNPQHKHSLPVWLSVPVWLAVFVSPTVYVLLLMFADRAHVSAAPGGVVVLLLCLIPVVALLACGTAVWRSKLGLNRGASKANSYQ